MHRSIDLRGLKCPIPILRLKKELNKEIGGSVIEVITSDPATVKDFEVFCNKTGDKILNSSITPGNFIFLIEKKIF